MTIYSIALVIQEIKFMGYCMSGCYFQERGFALKNVHSYKIKPHLRRYRWFNLTICGSYFTTLVVTFNCYFNFHKPYFSRNYQKTPFTNHWEWTVHKILVFKPAIILQYNIFKNILIVDFQHYPFLYQKKVL